MNYDLIVVGGGPAGLTAGIYGARAGKRVLIFERESLGGQITMSPVVENYPGLPNVSGADYAAAMFEQADGFGCEFAFEEVLSVTGEEGDFTVKSDGGEYRAAAVILAVGAASRKLGVSREEELTGHGVSYCAVCDGTFFRGKTVAVVGGGNSAVEDALYLADIAEKVYLIHRRTGFRAESAVLDALHACGKIEVITPAVVASLHGERELEGITITTPEGSEPRALPVKGLFVAVGRAPATDAFRSLVALDEAGYVMAGEDTATTVPGIYTAGDCRVKTVRQLTTACGDGAVAALAASEHMR